MGRILKSLTLSIVLIVTMTSAEGSTSNSPTEQQLIQDLEHASGIVATLTKTIDADLPWVGGGDHQNPCVDAEGRLIAYQATYSLWVSSKDAGRSLEDETAIATARDWLTRQGFEFRRDAKHEGGLREIWAVKETKTINVGVVVDAHSGGFRVKATTRCRSL